MQTSHTPIENLQDEHLHCVVYEKSKYFVRLAKTQNGFDEKSGETAGVAGNRDSSHGNATINQSIKTSNAKKPQSFD